jgi:hypothetical protein
MGIFSPFFCHLEPSFCSRCSPHSVTPNVARGGESKADAEKGFLKSKVETTRKTAERRANPEKRTLEWGKLIRNISFLAD